MGEPWYFNTYHDQSYEQAFIKFIGEYVYDIVSFVNGYLDVKCGTILEQKLNCTVTSEDQLLGLQQKFINEYQAITTDITYKFRELGLPEYLQIESNLLCVELHLEQDDVDRGKMFFLQQKRQQLSTTHPKPVMKPPGFMTQANNPQMPTQSGSFGPHMENKSKDRTVTSDKDNEGKKTLPPIQVSNVPSSTFQESIGEGYNKDDNKLKVEQPNTFLEKLKPESTSDNSKPNSSNDSKQMLQKKNDNTRTNTDDHESKFQNVEQNKDLVKEENSTAKQEPENKPAFKPGGKTYSSFSNCVQSGKQTGIPGEVVQKKTIEKKSEYDFSNEQTTTFMLFVPPHLGKVDSVHIISQYQPWNVELQLDPKLNRWVSEKVQVPKSADIKYKYNVKVPQEIYLRSLSGITKYEEYLSESNYRQYTYHENMKDIYRVPHSPKCIYQKKDIDRDVIIGLEHYLDEIRDTITKASIKSKINEWTKIEIILLLSSGDADMMNRFLHWFCSYLKGLDNVHILFMVYLLCRVFHKKILYHKDILKNQSDFTCAAAKLCLTAIQEADNTMITESLESLLLKYIPSIVAKAYNCDMCIYSLSWFSPLLSDTSIKNMQIQVKSTTLEEEDIKNCVLRLLDNLSGGSKTTHDLFLKMIKNINHIRLLVLINGTITSLTFEKKVEIMAQIHAMTAEKLVHEIKQRKSPANLKGLKDLLMLVDGEDLHRNIQETVQIQIISIIEAKSQTWDPEAASSLYDIITSRIIDKKTNFYKIINSLANHNDQNAQKVILRILNDENILQEINDTKMVKIACESLLNTANQRYGQVRNAEQIRKHIEKYYSTLNDLLDTKYVRSCKDISIQLKEMVWDWVNKLKIENICEIFCCLPAEMDMTVITYHLSQKAAVELSRNMEINLKSLLCVGTHGNINARRESIVNILLNNYPGLNDNMEVSKYNILFTLNNSPFWNVVFSHILQQKGHRLSDHKTVHKVVDLLHKFGKMLERKSISYGMAIDIIPKISWDFEYDTLFAYRSTWQTGYFKQCITEVENGCSKAQHDLDEIESVFEILEKLKFSEMGIDMNIEDLQHHKDCHKKLYITIKEHPLDILISEKPHLKTLINIHKKAEALKEVAMLPTFHEFLKPQMAEFQRSIAELNASHADDDYSAIMSLTFSADKFVTKTEDILVFIADKCVAKYNKLIEDLLYAQTDTTLEDIYFFFKTFESWEEEVKNIEIWKGKEIPKMTKYALSYAGKYDETHANASALGSIATSMGVNIPEDKCDIAIAMKDILQMAKNEKEITMGELYTKTHRFLQLIKDVTGRRYLEQVIQELGSSRGLLQFLLEIVDDDLRNLIDAVEEHSDQYVQESTVSDLIQLKRFLLPLLQANVDSCQGVFDILMACQSGDIATVPGQISTCMSSIHTLRALYKSVANRGELTKEKASNILHNGVITVNVQSSTKELVVHFENQDEVYGIEDLQDLRSRCLLISNTDKSIHEDNAAAMIANLKSFIALTDVTFEILELAICLHKVGHFKYQDFQLKISSHDEKQKFSDLSDIAQKLRADQNEWLSILDYVRRKHYFMNFVHSEQIYTLLSFFEGGKFNSDVECILQYLMQGNNIDATIRDCYDPNHSQADNLIQKKLENLSFCLSNMMKICKNVKYVGFPQDQEFVNSTMNLNSTVTKGELFVAQNDTKSIQFVPVLLALYANTTGKFPRPHEIIICNEETTWEEINMIINRAILYEGDNTSYNLHSIVGVENLEYEVQNKLAMKLRKVEKMEGKNYLLAVLCRADNYHQFLVEFKKYVHRVQGISYSALQNCLHLACPGVQMITSDVPGLGKSEYIFREAFKTGKMKKCVGVSGSVTKEGLIKLFTEAKLNCHRDKHLHLDIGVVDSSLILDSFLFEFIVLRCAVSGTSMIHLPVSEVSIEVANTLKHQLRDDLFVMSCFKRVNLEWENFDNFTISNNIQSAVQIVCNYLYAQETGSVKYRDVMFNGPRPVKSLSRDDCIRLLRSALSSTSDMSFTIANVFIHVLAQQLLKLSSSPFFKVRNLYVMLKFKMKVYKVREFIVEEIVQSAKEFACRSITTCKSAQNIAVEGKIMNKNTEAMLKRVEGMIHWSDSNHFIVAFHGQFGQSVTPIYRKLAQVPNHVQILFTTQMGKQLEDFADKSQKQLEDILKQIVQPSVHDHMRREFAELMRKYALTPDNILKMVLIMMRLNANIPVLLMGETGCGKTSLIQYLAITCGVELKILPLHAGVDSHEIQNTVSQANKQALFNPKQEVWIFLDEINTCHHLGLINDILCHRSLNGSPLSPNLKLLAACNPYRMRAKVDVFTAGLTGKSSTDQFSQLVYRVHPLPESLLDYVWDYGTLSLEDEKKYIFQMVLGIHDQIPDSSVANKLSTLLSKSQLYIREVMKNNWCVSLRDVNRCCYLITWFIDMLKRKAGFCREGYAKPSTVGEYCKRAVLLSLAHCYEVRLHTSATRNKYWQEIYKVIESNQKLKTEGYKKLKEIIRVEQMDILDRMKIEDGIAKNAALRENVFVILVCMLNKIPIFLVGKPGCSKSLSMQLLKGNLRGLDSPDPYFQTLPQIYVVSYQGSESSTSEGIIKIFQKAKKYKEQAKEHENILPVVLLDEIGLAEVSKYNPLKVLHNLLEPTSGRFPDVAVVGISNWALDAAKMNRAIHLSRPDLNEEQLFDTGVSINNARYHGRSNMSASPCKIDKEILKALAHSYFTYHNEQKIPNFHGLRDYYSLIKYVSRTLQSGRSNSNVNDVINTGLRRNFGGLPKQLTLFLQSFFKEFLHSSNNPCTIEQCLTENIKDIYSRHLMIITNGDTVLGAIGNILKQLGKEYRTFFGSNFEEDQKEEYSYRMLSNIIYCMENGIVLILKDLEDIYGSLYDMLNQNYTLVGKKKNCRIALGAHSNPMCQVHDNFRCIVLVDENRLDYSDPPFLNRFEKQRFHFDDLLNEEELEIKGRIEEWMQSFQLSSERAVFSENDTFLGFHQESLPSLIKSVTANNQNFKLNDAVEICKSKLLMTCTPDSILRLSHSIIGIQENSEVAEIQDTYFRTCFNDGLANALGSIVKKPIDVKDIECLKMVFFTRSNIHTDVTRLLQKENIQVECLSMFKSERQMTSKFHDFFMNSQASNSVLLIQCNMASDREHILLAKLQIENQRNQYLKTKEHLLPKHVCFLVHLPKHSSNKEDQRKFDYSNQWELYTVDVLDQRVALPVSFEESYSGGLMNAVINKSEVELLKTSFKPVEICVKENILWAFNCMQYRSSEREAKYLTSIVESIKSNSDVIHCLSSVILQQLKDEKTDANFTIADKEHWQVIVANDIQLLSKDCSILDAWQTYLENCVKRILAKLVCFLEMYGAWECILSCSTNLKQLWQRRLEMMMKSEMLSSDIAGVPSGLMSMVIDTKQINLKFPFSRAFLDRLTELTPLVLRDLTMNWYGLDSTNDLDENELITMVLKYATLVESRFKSVYPEISVEDEDLQILVEDYCNEFSWSSDVNLEETVRINLCKGFLDGRIARLDKDIAYITKLAAYLVVYNIEKSRIWCLLKMFSLCDNIILQTVNEKLENLSTAAVQSKIEDLESINQSVNTDNIYTEDALIQIVTEAMIPNGDRIKTDSDVQKWFEKTCNILSYCSKMGSQCRNIHFLRFCLDIVNFLEQEKGLHAIVLVRFTELTCGRENTPELDKPEAFQYICDLTNNEENSSILNLQQLVCMYLVRCIEYNQETALIQLALEKICNLDFPSKRLEYIGPFAHCLLYDLTQEDFDVTSFIHGGDIIEMTQSNVLNELHNALSRFDKAHPFYVLCLDIVQQIIESSMEEELVMSQDEVSKFTKVVTSMTNENNKGLNWIITLSICKIYLRQISKVVKQSGDHENYSFFQQIDSVLHIQKTEEDLDDIYCYFLTLLRDGCIRDLEKRCSSLEDSFPSMKKLSWPDDDILSGVGKNVLAVETNYKEVYQALLDTQETDGFKRLEDMFKDSKNLSSIVAAVCEKYFWPKYVSDHTKDTDRGFGNWLEEFCDFEPLLKKLLLCLSGKHDFALDLLNISTQKTFEDIAQADVLLNLLSTIMTNVRYDKVNKRYDTSNVFACSVLQPDEVKSMWMPQKYFRVDVTSTSVFCQCQCKKYLYTKSSLSVCPLCTYRNNKMEPVFANISKTNTSPRNVQDVVQNTDCKDISLVDNLIMLLLEASLLAGHSVGEFTVSWSSLNVPYKEIQSNFLKRWDFIREVMHISPSNMSMMLHKLIYEHKELFCGNDFDFTDNEMSKIYSENLVSAVVEMLTMKQRDIVAFTKEVLLNGKTSNKLGFALSSIYTSLEMRQVNHPSIEHMKTLMHVISMNEQNEFRFLQLVLNWEFKLTLLDFLLPIMKWQFALHNALNHKLTREQAGVTTINQFLTENYSDEKGKLRVIFEKVSILLQDIKENKYRSVWHDTAVRNIGLSTPISECVIEDNKHFMIDVVTCLIDIQNEFLKEVADLCLSNYAVLQFMRENSVVVLSPTSAHQLKERDVVNLRWDKKLLRFATNELDPNCGKGIIYDFRQIEQKLATEMVLGKPILHFDVDSFRTVYKNEMFHWCSHIFNEVRNLVEQHPITKQIQDSIQQGLRESPEALRSTLDLLEMVIVMLHKTGGSSKESILSYAKQWNINSAFIRSNTILNQLETCLYLCHVLELYENIEETLADMTADSLPPKYRATLSYEIEELQTFVTGKHVTLEVFKTALTRFMSRYLQSTNTTVSPTSEMSVSICKVQLWRSGVDEDGSLSDSSTMLSQVFPKKLKVAHVYATYQFVSNLIQEEEKGKQENVKEKRTFPSRRSGRAAMFNW